MPLLPTDPTTLRLAARITIAAMAAYGLAYALTLPEALWAVITALIVVQMSVGGTIGAGIDRMVGTLAGAVLGGIAATVHTFWHTVPVVLLLLLAVAPLSIIAAKRPSYRVAPVTAALMLLIVHDAAQPLPLEMALDRVFEIAVGCVVGIAVSILVLPYHAEQLLVDRVANGLRVLAELVTALLGARDEATRGAIDRLNARMRTVLTSCEAAAADVQREQRLHLGGRRDPEPLFRTLRRLRSDVAIIDRAMACLAGPPPDLAPLARAITDFLEAAAHGLPRCAAPPPLEPLDQALAALETASSPAPLPLSFAAAALRQHCGDLHDRMTERAAAA